MESCPSSCSELMFFNIFYRPWCRSRRLRLILSVLFPDFLRFSALERGFIDLWVLLLHSVPYEPYWPVDHTRFESHSWLFAFQ